MKPIVFGMGGGGDEVIQSKFLLSVLLRSGSFRKYVTNTGGLRVIIDKGK